LSTAWALTQRSTFSQCSITVVDRADPSQPGVFPAPDAASNDSSRIIRADYADPAYAALCAAAQVEWRKQSDPSDLGAQGRYNESGLVLVADGVPPPPATPPTGKPEDKTKLTGMDYTRYSWANVMSLAAQDPSLVETIRELPDASAIAGAMGTNGGGSGSWGYLNKGSGWADAGASMAWLCDKVKKTGRVSFVPGNVVSLEHSGDTVTGARLADGRVLSADLVMLAAGAWTGSLLDISGRAVATGQVLGYLSITPEEEAQLSKMPVLLNLTSGLFVIPPRNGILKFARHAYGYINPTTVSPLPASPDAQVNNTTSLPRTSVTDPAMSIPQEGEDDLRRALAEMVRLPGLQDRPFFKTRICWYSDTPDADFIIDYHPQWQNLFIATGDSGHGFKFLPVIGDKIADCIERTCPAEFKGKWDWKQADSDAFVITEDGSRGGLRALILDEELAKSRSMPN